MKQNIPKFTYASPEDSFLKRGIIQVIERLTGRHKIEGLRSGE